MAEEARKWWKGLGNGGGGLGNGEGGLGNGGGG